MIQQQKAVFIKQNNISVRKKMTSPHQVGDEEKHDEEEEEEEKNTISKIFHGDLINFAQFFARASSVDDYFSTFVIQSAI